MTQRWYRHMILLVLATKDKIKRFGGIFLMWFLNRR